MPPSKDLVKEAEKWPVFENPNPGCIDPATMALTVYRALQARREVETLMLILQALQPKVILEIGTYKGGSMFCWTQAVPQARAVGVDSGAGVSWDKRNTRWFTDYTRIQGSSQHPLTVEAVKRELDGVPVDFLFIDGDHKTESVIADYENYSPFCGRRSVIGFHDVYRAMKEGVPAIRAAEAWEEIKQGKDYLEMHGGHNWGGIGVLFNP